MSENDKREMKVGSTLMKVDPAIDFTQSAYSSGSYHYRKLLPLQTITLSPTSITECVFELPNTVYNLSKSSLNFDISIAATANWFKFLHNGFCSPIDSIDLSDAAGTKLVDLREVAYFTKTVWGPCTSREDFLTMPAHSAGDIGTEAKITRVGHLFHPVIHTTDGLGGNKYVASADGETTLVDMDSGFNAEPSNFITHSTAGNITYVKIRIPLKMFYHTLLAMNKDLYFNQTMRLTVRFRQGDKMGYETKSLTDYATNHAVALTTGPAIANTCLYLAVESLDDVILQVKNQVATNGIQMLVPFVHSYKNGASMGTAGALYSYNRKWNNGHGRNLLRIYTAAFNSVDTDSMVAQNYNDGGLFIANIRSSLNSKPLQDYALTVTANEPYMWLKEKLAGSAIRDNFTYNARFFWVDDFSGLKTKEFVANDGVSNGLRLNEEIDHTVEITAGASPSFVYVFGVVQKLLNIAPTGIIQFS